MHRLPFKWSSFDLIFTGELIEHLPAPVLFLTDAHYCLKKNDKIVLSTPNASGLWSLIFDHLERRLAFILRLKGTRANKLVKGHVSPFTYGKLNKALSAAGFKVKDIPSYGGFGTVVSIDTLCSGASNNME